MFRRCQAGCKWRCRCVLLWWSLPIIYGVTDQRRGNCLVPAKRSCPSAVPLLVPCCKFLTLFFEKILNYVANWHPWGQKWAQKRAQATVSLSEKHIMPVQKMSEKAQMKKSACSETAQTQERLPASTLLQQRNQPFPYFVENSCEQVLIPRPSWPSTSARWPQLNC